MLTKLYYIMLFLYPCLTPRDKLKTTYQYRTPTKHANEILELICLFEKHTEVWWQTLSRTEVRMEIQRQQQYMYTSSFFRKCGYNNNDFMKKGDIPLRFSYLFFWRIKSIIEILKILKVIIWSQTKSLSWY